MDFSSVHIHHGHSAALDNFDFLDNCMKQKCEILLSQEPLQKSVGGATAPASTLRELTIGHALLGLAVVVRVKRIAQRASTLNERLGDGMRPFDRSNVKRPASSSQGTVLVASFQIAKNRHYLFCRPLPCVIAKSRPVIEISRGGAHILCAVNAAAAAQDASPKPQLPHTVAAWIRLRVIAPVIFFTSLKHAGRELNKGRPIGPARFENQRVATGFHQLVGERTAGGACSYHDAIPVHSAPLLKISNLL